MVDRFRATLADADLLLTEHPTDSEDEAGLQTAAQVLDSLTESERRELARIRATLHRMALGGYGECARCHEDIDIDRLRAVPEAELCARCACQVEQNVSTRSIRADV